MPKTKVEMLRWLIEGTPVREGYSTEELMSEVDELIKAVREESEQEIIELKQKINDLEQDLHYANEDRYDLLNQIEDLTNKG